MNPTLRAVLIGVGVGVLVLGLFLPRPSVVEKVVEKFGFGGLEISGNCVRVGGGAMLCSYEQKMAAASTTCSFRPREMASSTLVRATAQIQNPFGGTFDMEFGKSASIQSTTTRLSYYTGIATGITLQASTTAGHYTNAPYNFDSSEYLNIKIGTGTPSNMTGRCSALFMSI